MAWAWIGSFRNTRPETMAKAGEIPGEVGADRPGSADQRVEQDQGAPGGRDGQYDEPDGGDRVGDGEAGYGGERGHGHGADRHRGGGYGQWRDLRDDPVDVHGPGSVAGCRRQQFQASPSAGGAQVQVAGVQHDDAAQGYEHAGEFPYPQAAVGDPGQHGCPGWLGGEQMPARAAETCCWPVVSRMSGNVACSSAAPSTAVSRPSVGRRTSLRTASGTRTKGRQPGSRQDHRRRGQFAEHERGQRVDRSPRRAQQDQQCGIPPRHDSGYQPSGRRRGASGTDAASGPGCSCLRRPVTYRMMRGEPVAVAMS